MGLAYPRWKKKGGIASDAPNSYLEPGNLGDKSFTTKKLVNKGHIQQQVLFVVAVAMKKTYFWINFTV